MIRNLCKTFHHNVRVWHFLVFVLMVDYGDAKSDNVSFHRALTNDPWQTIISPLGENLKIDKHFFAFRKVYSTTSMRLSLYHTAKRKYFISNIEILHFRDLTEKLFDVLIEENCQYEDRWHLASSNIEKTKCKILIQGNISYQNHESQGPPRDKLVFSSFPLLHLALMRGHAPK